MRAAVRDRQRGLPSLATTSTLVHAQVIANGIYVVQGNKNIAAQYHRAPQLGQFPVANHVCLPGRESEHLQAGLSSVPVFGIDPVFDLAEHFLERGIAALNEGVGHADYGREAVADGTRISRSFLTHPGRCLPGMKPSHQDAFVNEVCLRPWRSLIIIFIASP